MVAAVAQANRLVLVMPRLSLVIDLPEHWAERTAVILAERLVESELPPELTVTLTADGVMDVTDGRLIETWETS